MPAHLRRPPTHPAAAVLDLVGAFQGQEGASQIEVLIGRLISEGIVHIVANCQGLEFMDLSAACGLVCHLLRLQYRGGNLTLCCLSESMGQLLFGRFEIGVEYVDSEEEALAACTPLSHTPPEGDPLRGWNLAVFGETEIQGDVGIVYLRGAIYGPPEIDYFQKLVDPMETPKMLIQCENLCAITADGVGVFVKLLKTYQSRQGLVLYRLNGLPHYFFATTGLDKIFPMADSIEDALAAFR